MTNKLTPGEALQKILDALGVDDLNVNSRGLFEDYIRQAARAESAKEIKQLQADMGGLENLLKLERDKNTRILRESDAEIERLKHVIGSFRYALLKYREEEWLGGEDGIAAEALESETIAATKKEG